MRVIVLLNAKAGTGPDDQADEDAGRIRAAFLAAGVEADVRPTEGPKLADAAKAAADEIERAGGGGGGGGGGGAVVAAGGDGTQSAVAGALAGRGVPMGVLAMGTLNHFAKDLGVPLELPAAAALIATGKPRPVDVATVNGRVFVNNSSIGLYPRVVRHRDQMREQLGRGKWVAMLIAVVSIFKRFPLVRLRMVVNGAEWRRTIPFVFVGNNQYEIESMNLGKRTRLDAGDLCVYFPNRTGRLGMILMAFRALVGRLRQARDFNALCATEIWIDAHGRRMSVAFDGEVDQLEPPLHYQIRPGALRVILPAGGE